MLTEWVYPKKGFKIRLTAREDHMNASVVWRCYVMISKRNIPAGEVFIIYCPEDAQPGESILILTQLGRFKIDFIPCCEVEHCPLQEQNDLEDSESPNPRTDDKSLPLQTKCDASQK